MQVSDKCLLDVQNVTMRFSRYANGILSLKELFIGLFTGKLKRDKIISLQDVSFQIHEGEAVAILGHNGAGKSTLLKIVSYHHFLAEKHLLFFPAKSVGILLAHFGQDGLYLF